MKVVFVLLLAVLAVAQAQAQAQAAWQVQGQGQDWRVLGGGRGAPSFRAAGAGDTGDRYDTSSLRLLSVIFRHGQRTPADTYPNDPYKDHSFDPVGWGQLTLDGRRDQYEQGRWLRRRYDSFLGETYHPNVMTLQTTDVDRTKMSALLEMAGLWPPAPEQRWHPSLDWQPVPLNYQSLDKDRLLLVRIPCGRYGELLEEVMKSQKVQTILRQNARMFDWLSARTGKKIATPDDIQDLYSTLKAEAEFNLTLPEWTQSVYPGKLEELTAISFEINALTREMQKIKGGPLVKEVLKNSIAKAEGSLKPAKRRMYAYAGHDSTISNFLITLGAWDTQIPGYGIMILVELHEHPETHEYGLKLFLRNSTDVPPYPLTMKGCDHFCPLNRVIQLTRDVIPDELERSCKAQDPNYVPPPPSGP